MRFDAGTKGQETAMTTRIAKSTIPRC